MVSYSMKIRKCVYTNKDAKAKDSVIPKKILKDEIHNWSNNVPVSEEYKTLKSDRLPTELEMQANEYFHLLELSKLRVRYYEEKLEEIQKEITEKLVIVEKKGKTKKEMKKDKEIKKAHKQQELQTEIEEKINSTLEGLKFKWD
jgi:hypothetical protein